MTRSLKMADKPGSAPGKGEGMGYLDELRLIESALRAQFDAAVRACYHLAVASDALATAEKADTDAYFRRAGSRAREETRAERDEAQARFEALLVEYPRARAARQAWQAVQAIVEQVEYDIMEYTL